MGIENTTNIFLAAGIRRASSHSTRLTISYQAEDATFAARVISGWLTHYLTADAPQGTAPSSMSASVRAGEANFQMR